MAPLKGRSYGCEAGPKLPILRLSTPGASCDAEAAVAQIVSMGFSRKSAVAALEQYGDVQRAIDGLLASS